MNKENKIKIDLELRLADGILGEGKLERILKRVIEETSDIPHVSVKIKLT